jgi:hypothetical protein
MPENSAADRQGNAKLDPLGYFRLPGNRKLASVRARFEVCHDFENIANG